jgi:hypothetical protein
VHGDPCPGDVDTVGRDMAHGVGLDGRVGAGMAGDLALVGVVGGAVAGGEPGALRRPAPPPAMVKPAGRWLLVAEAEVDIGRGGSPMAECRQLGLVQLRAAIPV